MAWESARFVDRWARAQALMDEQNVDVVLVGPGSDLFYLLGTAGHPSPRLTLFVLPRSGQPALLVPALEGSGYADQRDAVRMLPWRDGTDAVTVLADSLSIDPAAALAVNDRLWSTFLLRLQTAWPRARWSSAAPVLRTLRSIKDASELASLREASRRTDDAWREFVIVPLAGSTERAAAERLVALLAARGMPPSFDVSVAAAENGASPHHTPGERVIRAGDAVVCDFGGILDGYCSDMTRTVHVGPPGARFQRVYATVLAAQEAAFKAARVGVPLEEIDAAARGVIEAAGFGQWFIHRTGHGVGIDIHEEPYLVAGNRQPLAPGMAFSDEPGIYLPGEFGVRIEDLLVCGDQRAERLNQAPRELTVVA